MCINKYSIDRKSIRIHAVCRYTCPSSEMDDFFIPVMYLSCLSTSIFMTSSRHSFIHSFIHVFVHSLIHLFIIKAKCTATQVACWWAGAVFKHLRKKNEYWTRLKRVKWSSSVSIRVIHLQLTGQNGWYISGFTYSMFFFECNITWRHNSKGNRDNWILKKVPKR